MNLLGKLLRSIWEYDMTILSNCFECEHFEGGKDFSCKAFKKIPNEIVFNDKEHKKPVKGQIGDFVFTPKKK